MSPGRYLLAAIVICYATDRTLTWIGVRASLASQAPDPAGDVPPVVREIQRVTWHVFESQSIRIAVNVVLAGLVAVVLWRLFQGILDRGAEALALGGFLVGHTVILEAAAKLLYAPAVYLSTGQPAQFAYLLYLGLTTVYIGWALYDWLGTNWRPVAKGMFGLAVAYVDMAAILTIAPLGYGLWLIQMAPETYAQPEGIAVGFSLAALLAAVPLLIHAGLEAYVRLR